MTLYKVTGRLRLTGALWTHYYKTQSAALTGIALAVKAGDLFVTYTVIEREVNSDVNEQSEPAEQSAEEKA